MNVNELEGAELDAAVAKAEGWQWTDGCFGEGVQPAIPGFSSVWAAGGPIIERERINLSSCERDGVPDGWIAFHSDVNSHESPYGKTPLIAAMRVFVASKGKP